MLFLSLHLFKTIHPKAILCQNKIMLFILLLLLLFMLFIIVIVYVVYVIVIVIVIYSIVIVNPEINWFYYIHPLL